MSMDSRETVTGQDPLPDPCPAEDTESLFKDAGALSHELRALVHDQLEIVVLETRLVARTLTRMIALAVGMGLLLVTAWLGFVGAAVMTLTAYGMGAAAAMVVAATFNLIAALLLYLFLRHQSGSLGWPVTLRTLRPAPDEAQGRVSP